ncbi:hypothetical protein [Leucobacter chinensis]|uniref:hypothetical protein n=1 Tax=Leucobacter chinensis TaxID=2851010 RepID=UPI001C22EA9B|nr:hypothetical protein [Leucobacter chinensis]
MAFDHIDYATYEALRDMDITPNASFEDTTGQWDLGHATSWSRWGTETADLEPITANSAAEFATLKPLSTRIVFFAINMGGEAMAEHREHWRNFHTRGHRGDTTLRNSFALAFEGHKSAADIPGFYVSDVFKLIPTKDSNTLASAIKKHRIAGRDHVERCAALLQEELMMCRDGIDGQVPILVAMGKAAFTWLSGDQKDQRIAEVVDKTLGAGARDRVVRMAHYANGAGTNVQRAETIRSVLELAS